MKATVRQSRGAFEYLICDPAVVSVEVGYLTGLLPDVVHADAVRDCPIDFYFSRVQVPKAAHTRGLRNLNPDCAIVSTMMQTP